MTSEPPLDGKGGSDLEGRKGTWAPIKESDLQAFYATFRQTDRSPGRRPITAQQLREVASIYRTALATRAPVEGGAQRSGDIQVPRWPLGDASETRNRPQDQAPIPGANDARACQRREEGMRGSIRQRTPGSWTI